MASTPEEIQDMIDALDVRILALSTTVSVGYNIDGQSVNSGAADLKALVDLRKALMEQLNAAYGPWEVEDRVIG
jgi:hypothetical protein